MGRATLGAATKDVLKGYLKEVNDAIPEEFDDVSIDQFTAGEEVDDNIIALDRRYVGQRFRQLSKTYSGYHNHKAYTR